MIKYDVNDIFWKYNNPKDLEAKIGKRVFYGMSYDIVLREAQAGYKASGTLEGVSISPYGWKGFQVFTDDGDEIIVPFILVEKEPERKPLNLSDPKVRNFLRDKWIRKKNDSYEKKITYFSKNSAGWKCCNLYAEDLFKEWEFIEPINGSTIIGELK